MSAPPPVRVRVPAAPAGKLNARKLPRSPVFEASVLAASADVSRASFSGHSGTLSGTVTPTTATTAAAAASQQLDLLSGGAGGVDAFSRTAAGSGVQKTVPRAQKTAPEKAAPEKAAAEKVVAPVAKAASINAPAINAPGTYAPAKYAAARNAAPALAPVDPFDPFASMFDEPATAEASQKATAPLPVAPRQPAAAAAAVHMDWAADLLSSSPPPVPIPTATTVVPAVPTTVVAVATVIADEAPFSSFASASSATLAPATAAATQPAAPPSYDDLFGDFASTPAPAAAAHAVKAAPGAVKPAADDGWGAFDPFSGSEAAVPATPEPAGGGRDKYGLLQGSPSLNTRGRPGSAGGSAVKPSVSGRRPPATYDPLQS